MAADSRDRERMVFETSDVLKRAIRMRAGMDGLRPADVINAALEAYLKEEIVLVRERHGDSPTGTGKEGAKIARKKEDRSGSA
jgi:hypothetical protein